MKKIVIGTRGSQLALIQTDIVRKQLEALAPGITIDIQTITTKGDKNMSPVPLDSIGKGWFTKEIDKALLEGRIDIAVHSLKDLPEVLPKGLTIAAIPEREDAREALVTQNNVSFANLPKGAIIGTDSTRRKSQILHKRPDLIVESVRGNVITRLAKLDAGDYDGLFLAVAGLKRLGLESRITEYFSVDDIVPSPGQGALAVVIKSDNTSLLELLQKLNHGDTITAIAAERAFSKAVGGGCKLPVGIYARCEGETITLFGVIGSVDGQYIAKQSVKGKRTDGIKLAKALAKDLLSLSKPWYTKRNQEARDLEEHQKYIVLTRPETENKQLEKQIEAQGYQVFSYPSIAIHGASITEDIKQILKNIAAYDVIIFTSRNGVHYFMEGLKGQSVDEAILQEKYIATVGSQTAKEAEKYHLPVQFIPSAFTTDDLAKELPNISGKRILLPRANIASEMLVQKLQERGAIVTNIPIYTTEHTQIKNNTFEELLKNKQVQCIFFTSPSTVEGFLENIEGMKAEADVFSLPVLSIGPVTTKALKKHGFQYIHTADTFTLEGMITKLKESTL